MIESPLAKSQSKILLSLEPLTSWSSPIWRRQVTQFLCPLRMVFLSKGVEGSLEGCLMTDNDQSDFNTLYISHQIPDYNGRVIASAGEEAIIKQD